MTDIINYIYTSSFSNIPYSILFKRNHSEAVFDIFNCANIFINNSMFTNNRGTGISRTSFRANTGAVSIGFNNINTDVLHPLITISGCKFVSNRATAPLRSFRTTSSAFFNRVFTGRGGGLGIFVNESIHNITGTISDNAFVGNFARSFGGGLYIVVFGDNTQNLLLVERNVFEDNLAILGGGGFIMTFFSNGIEDTPHQTNITDCFFSGNSGESGGALLIYLAYDGMECVCVDIAAPDLYNYMASIDSSVPISHLYSA